MTAWRDKSPDEIMQAASLTKTEKLAVLKDLELDAERLAVADEENMAGGEQISLRAVRQAIRTLENRD
jgi:hypothetical protein